MTYVGWVAHYEGQGNAAYYDVLLPRVMDEITTLHATRAITIPQTPALRLDVGRSVDQVAQELCRNSASFHLIFIHADTGGRAQEAGIDDRAGAYYRAVRERCGWPHERCIVVRPRHETEAWLLADPEAVMGALGMTGDASRHGLPPNAAAAEALPDPKIVLSTAVRAVGRRKPRRASATLFARIAQMQRLNALREARSFRDFEADLRVALIDLGCLPRER